MSNQTEMEKRNMTYGALTNVVLVIAQSQRINQASSMMKFIFEQLNV